MTAVVVDASAAIEYLLRAARAERFERAIRDAGNALFVPSLCDVEVASTLRRAVLTGRLSPDRARQALGDYRDLPFTRFGHLALLDRILELRDNFSAYDATYVALAERLDAMLLTGDEALRRAVGRHLAVGTL